MVGEVFVQMHWVDEVEEEVSSRLMMGVYEMKERDFRISDVGFQEEGKGEYKTCSNVAIE